MSEQENTNIVKQTYEAFLRGDMESLLKLYAEDVQWDVYGPASLPTGKIILQAPPFEEFLAVNSADSLGVSPILSTCPEAYS